MITTTIQRKKFLKKYITTSHHVITGSHSISSVLKSLVELFELSECLSGGCWLNVWLYAILYLFMSISAVNDWSEHESESSQSK